jgi:glutamate carboxypeptidase
MKRLFLLMLAGCAGAPASSSIAPEERLAQFIDRHENEMFAALERVVNQNSGSLNREGLAAVRGMFEKELKALGFACTVVPGGTMEMLHCPSRKESFHFGDHLVARIDGGQGPRIILNGHFDTVFELSSPFQKMRREGNIIHGPGTVDMKAGILSMIYALKALQEVGALAQARITIILVADEELGSLDSRKLLEAEAKKHDAGFVFEGSAAGSMVNKRKGLGQVQLVVHGTAAHAGNAFWHGVSAVRELAHKVIEIEKLTGQRPGLTVNVGSFLGGDKRNIVPECAECQIDLRYEKPEDGEWVVGEIKKIAERSFTFNDKINKGTRTEMWHSLHRPPKLVTPEFEKLLQHVLTCAEALGQKLGTNESGGGTDGSLMQAVGLPTIDSMGPEGSGAHTEREQMTADSYLWKTKLAALVLYRYLKH